MASTQGASPDDEVTSLYRRSFTTSAQPQPAAEEEAGPLMSRRAVLGGAGMGAASLLCFAMSIALSGGEAGVSDQTVARAADLESQISTAEVKLSTLPTAEDGQRALTAALSAAEGVASRQNEYRVLTPQITDGVLDSTSATTTRRNLRPYFTSSIEDAELDPWYVLASDAEVPAGLGLASEFASGFAWVAQTPRTISDDSTIPVTWLALPTGESSPVLAWARADFQARQRTFSNLEHGVTTTGEKRGMEVIVP